MSGAKEHAGPLVPAIVFDSNADLVGCAPVVVCAVTFETQQYTPTQKEQYQKKFQTLLNNIAQAVVDGKKVFEIPLDSTSMNALIDECKKRDKFTWNTFGKVAQDNSNNTLDYDWDAAIALVAAKAFDKQGLHPVRGRIVEVVNIDGVRQTGDDAFQNEAEKETEGELLSSEKIKSIIDSAIEYGMTLDKETSLDALKVWESGTYGGNLRQNLIDVTELLNQFKSAIELNFNFKGNYTEFLKKEVDIKYFSGVLSDLRSIAGIDEAPFQLHQKLIQDLVHINKLAKIISESNATSDELKQLCIDIHNDFVKPLYVALIGSKQRYLIESSWQDLLTFRTPLAWVKDYVQTALGRPPQIQTLAQMNTTAPQNATPVRLDTKISKDKITRMYVPRSFLVPICIKLCGMYKSGFGFTPRYKLPTAGGISGLQQSQKAKILIRAVSGLTDDDSIKVSEAMCPSPEAANRFLIAFQEWYNSDDEMAKALKSYYTQAGEANTLQKLFSENDITPEFTAESDNSVLYNLGINYERAKSIFQWPLRGDHCLIPRTSRLPTSVKGHTLFRFAHQPDFIRQSNARALGMPENTLVPVLEYIASAVFNGPASGDKDKLLSQLKAYHLLLEPITHHERELLQQWVDQLKRCVASMEDAIEDEATRVGQVADAVDLTESTLNSVYTIIQNPKLISPKLKEMYRETILNNMIQNHKGEPLNSQRALLDMIKAIFQNTYGEGSTIIRILDDAKMDPTSPIEEFLSNLRVRRLLYKNNEYFMDVAHILYG